MGKYFSLVYSGDIHRGEGDKIIPAEEFSTLMQASDVLEAAKKDVKAYLEGNKEECLKFKNAAKEDGFKEGLTEFNKHILHYEQKLKNLDHELQKLVLPLALKAAKKIVGEELKTNPDTLIDIVRQSLKPVMHHHRIKIYVSKQDLRLFEENKDKIRSILEHVQTFAIEGRDDVGPGGCIIETEAGIINASLENQWHALERAFNAFMKQ